jgi:hypothetical protein
MVFRFPLATVRCAYLRMPWSHTSRSSLARGSGGPRPEPSRGRKDQLAFNLAQQVTTSGTFRSRAIPRMARSSRALTSDAYCDDLTQEAVIGAWEGLAEQPGQHDDRGERIEHGAHLSGRTRCQTRRGTCCLPASSMGLALRISVSRDSSTNRCCCVPTQFGNRDSST